MSHRKNPISKAAMRRLQERQPANLEVRPYSEKEVANIWRLLNMRGSNRLKLAQALAEEAGLRTSEICDIRLGDIDLTNRTILVRNSNPDRPRVATFHERTWQHLQLWLEECTRQPRHNHLVPYLLHQFCTNKPASACLPKCILWHKEWCRPCADDHLLVHGVSGRPYSVSGLLMEFARALYKGRGNNADGIDHFSIQRSRYLMAARMAAAGAGANEIMQQAGWSVLPPFLSKSSGIDRGKSTEG